MLERLKRWIRQSPRPIVVEFDERVIAHASPGDVLVFTFPSHFSQQVIDESQAQLRAFVELRSPGVGIVFCAGGLAVKVTKGSEQ